MTVVQDKADVVYSFECRRNSFKDRPIMRNYSNDPGMKTLFVPLSLFSDRSRSNSSFTSRMKNAVATAFYSFERRPNSFEARPTNCDYSSDPGMKTLFVPLSLFSDRSRSTRA